MYAAVTSVRLTRGSYHKVESHVIVLMGLQSVNGTQNVPGTDIIHRDCLLKLHFIKASNAENMHVGAKTIPKSV